MNNTQEIKKGRILIIEDSRAIQNLTRQVITFHHDHDVVLANNGRLGLEIIETSPPFDIILMDMEMNVMGGEECIRKIKKLKDPAKANTPAIACTGNSKEYTDEDFKNMGFSNVFIKPINYKGLTNYVESILSEKQK